MNDNFCSLYMETAVSNTKNRHFTTEIATFDDITVSKSQIENGEVYMITFEENVFFQEKKKRYLTESIKIALVKLLKKHNVRLNSLVLVAGIGNDGMTADKLGVETLKGIRVSEHLYKKGLKPNGEGRLATIAGRVVGITGIHSFDVIKGVVSRIKPSIVIAVDTLATKHLNRLARTIQLTDGGITPGSGVNNSCRPLNSETLGVPVIAIGVPLVTYASSIAEALTSSYARRSLKESELIVTLKEIDPIVENLSQIIAEGINLAVHRNTII